MQVCPTSLPYKDFRQILEQNLFANASKQIKQTHAIKQDLLKRVIKSVGVAYFYSKGLKQLILDFLMPNKS